MILVIDIGNTNVKLGVFKNGELLTSFRFASQSGKTSDEYSVNVKNAFASAGLSTKDVESIVLSSVIPSLNYTFDHMCRYLFGKKPLVVTSKLDTGLTIAYGNPAELGSDRIATSAAAWHKYGGAPVIVVDFGTATTFNCITAEGVFEGGAIFPGMRTASEALVSATARLPRFELVEPDDVIGKTTMQNMQSGLFYGFVGMVEHIIGLMRAKPAFSDARVIATGGFCELLEPATKVFDVIDRKLSLDGLYLLHERNKAKAET